MVAVDSAAVIGYLALVGSEKLPNKKTLNFLFSLTSVPMAI